MTPTTLVYLAHPVAPYQRKLDTGSDAASIRYWGSGEHFHTVTTATNLRNAKRWLKALQDANPHAAVIAPWITECEIWDDANPEERATGLLKCCYVIARCDSIVLVGGRISNGMGIESNHAILSGVRVYDLTHLGQDPPNQILLKATVTL